MTTAVETPAAHLEPGRELDLASIEGQFVRGDVEGALARLDRLDLTTMPVPLFDRALPLLLMAAMVVKGEERALQILDEVAQARGAADPVIVAVLKNYRAEAGGDPVVAERLATEALTELRELDAAPVAQHRALTNLINVRVDQGLGFDHEAYRAAAALEPGLTLVAPVDSAEAQRGLLSYQVGDIDTSRTSLRLLYERAVTDGQLMIAGLFATHRAMVELFAGRPHAARAYLADGERLGALPDPPTPSVLRARGLIAVQEGDEGALRGLLAEPTFHGSEAHGAFTRAALVGLAAARREEWREAGWQLRKAERLADSLGLHEPGRRLWLDFPLAHSYVALGQLDEAAEVCARLRAMSGGRRPLLDGVAARVEGLLAAADDPGRALALLEDSVAMLAGEALPDQLVLSLIELGRRHRADGRFAEARRVLERAGVVAAQSSDRTLVAAAGRVLDESSLDSLLEHLTEREREVALAAADGGSNRQIARIGNTSIRTVETQLSSIYRKLDISSRHQLTALVVAARR
ncbi:LuxR C-terminal-related transcriptional regulator [Promicromonospora sp. Populi]|uniref:LuxR C-terminal-related transcriptional regulator n=1 Tax=Promicromonospora sp. Populi TaxID=3239420 RepID=UPI0034E2625A